MSNLIEVMPISAADLYSRYMESSFTADPCRGCMLLHPDGFRYAIMSTVRTRFDGEEPQVVAVRYSEDHLDGGVWGPHHEVRPEMTLFLAVYSHDHD